MLLLPAYIPSVSSGESSRPLPTEQTGATAIQFHEGKVNYGLNAFISSTVRTSPRVWKATKCRVHRYQSCLQLSGLKRPLESSALHQCTLFLLRLIEKLHTGTTSLVRHGRLLSDSFLTTSGVCQECILYWLLPCHRLILSCCAGNLGINVGNENFMDLNYADDAACSKRAQPSEI